MIDLSNPEAVRAEALRRQAARAAGQPLTEGVYVPPPPPAPVYRVPRLSITILGAPRTKKNSTQNGQHSKAFSDYKKLALSQLREQFGEKPEPLPPMPYNLEAHYYLDRIGQRSDLVGLMQATCDILENAGLIDNDNWFRGLDRSRPHYPDDENYLSPRTVITISPITEAAA